MLLARCAVQRTANLRGRSTTHHHRGGDAGKFRSCLNPRFSTPSQSLTVKSNGGR